jgi:hypothetical protein
MSSGYILNLTTCFNAENFMYYFLPGISSGKILLFDKLTRNQLSNHENKQLGDINRKLNYLKEDLELSRLLHNYSISDIKINIVLDFKKWKFSGFGEYSDCLFAKMHLLDQLFNKYFSNQDLKFISFQYFILYDQETEREKSVCVLDIINSFSDIKIPNSLHQNKSLISFPTNFDIGSIPINLNNLISTDNIPSDKKTLINNWRDGLIENIKSKFIIEDNDFHQLLKERIDELIADFDIRIVLVQDFDIKKIEDIFQSFFKKFSSKSYLSDQKDLLFYYHINDKNAHDSYDKLSAFLVETIDFFGQNEPIDFINNSTTNNLVCNQNIVDKIEIDFEARSSLFSHYKAYLSASEKHLLNTTLSRRVNLYTLDSLNKNNEDFKLDAEKVEDFNSTNNLKSKLPKFFSLEKVDEIKGLLDKNSILPLENHIKYKQETVSNNTSTNKEISSEKETLDESEMKEELKTLLTEEANSKLSSKVDLEKYETEKSLYQDKIKKLQEELIESLYLLPKISDIIRFYAISTILILLFSMPLYSFINWEEASIFSVIFFVVLAIGGSAKWSSSRKIIIDNQEAIKLENIGLHNSLDVYRKSLEQLSYDIKRSVFRRRNIDALNKAVASVNEEKRKASIHQSFFEDLMKQINDNQINDNQIEVVIDLSLSPELSFKKTFNRKVLKIKNGSSEKYHDELVHQLGVISCLEFNPIA